MKLLKVGKEVCWPAGEPIPQSMEEALAGGWEVISGSGDGPDDFTEVGEMSLRKTVGTLALHLTVPYHSTITYGKPRKARARIITETRHFSIVDGSVVELHHDDHSGNGTVN